MDILEQTLQVNKLARKNRHTKTFSKAALLKVRAKYLLDSLAVPVKKLKDTAVYKEIGRVFAAIKGHISEIMPIAPQKRLLFQAALVSGVALIVTSVSQGATFTSSALNFSNDYIETYSMPGDILVADSDGYLVKINPQTNNSSRIGLTDFAVHTVNGGETLSAIAGNYGVKSETIMWENSLYNPNSLKIGQTLLVPPVDGVSYKVGSGDTLDKVAKNYSIESDSIVAQNNLETEILQKGQKLFLPGAKPKTTYVARAATTGRTTARSYTAAASSAVPIAGKPFIYPTRGKITQGFHGGHYALDIADTSRPPVWSAAGGTVTKASSGTWGGGYGNHVIVDHGNGLKTLYAHLGSVNVYEGQWLNQGDVLGIMGNTGRVYGVTGIHLHWEVIDNGVKKYPANFY